jgi:transcriptional regulator with XRE-family HTH domain
MTWGKSRQVSSFTPVGTETDHERAIRFRVVSGEREQEKSVSDIGRRLHRLRVRARLSQVALARAAGTTPKTISEIETGKRRPYGHTLARLDDALAAGGELGRVAEAERQRDVIPAHEVAELRADLAELTGLVRGMLNGREVAIAPGDAAVSRLLAVLRPDGMVVRAEVLDTDGEVLHASEASTDVALRTGVELIEIAAGAAAVARVAAALRASGVTPEEVAATLADDMAGLDRRVGGLWARVDGPAEHRRDHRSY